MERLLVKEILYLYGKKRRMSGEFSGMYICQLNNRKNPIYTNKKEFKEQLTTMAPMKSPSPVL